MNPRVFKPFLKFFQFFYLFMALFSGFFVAVCLDYGFTKEAWEFVGLSGINVFISQLFKNFYNKIP